MVGAGIAGLCVAWELLEQGQEAMLFEDPAQTSASAVAAGLLQLAGGRISAKHLALRRACWEYSSEFLHSLGWPSRRLSLLRLSRELSKARAFSATLAGLGLPTRVLNASDLKSEGVVFSQEPIEGAVGLEVTAVDPAPLLCHLRRELQRRGVLLRASRVRSVEADHVVEQSGQLVHGRAVILTSGAGLADLWRPAWQFQLQPGQGARYSGTHPLSSALEAPWSNQLLVPQPGGWTSCGEPMGLDDVAGEVIWRRSAVRAFTPDGLPLVGCLRPGVHALGGLGRNGLLTAPFLARGLVGSLLRSQSFPMLQAFSPDRLGIGVRRGWSR